MGVRVKDTDGVVKNFSRLYVKNASGVVKQVLSLYVLRSITQISDDPPTYQYNWELVGTYSPPTEYVPSVAIGRLNPVETGPQEFRVSWSTAVGGRQLTYNVAVDWYVNGFPAHEDVVPQSDGVVSRVYDASDSVYAIVYYINDAGGGPTTQVGPV